MGSSLIVGAVAGVAMFFVAGPLTAGRSRLLQIAIALVVAAITAVLAGVALSDQP